MKKFKVKKIIKEDIQMKNKFWRWMIRQFGKKFSIIIIICVGLSVFFLVGAFMMKLGKKGAEIIRDPLGIIGFDLKADENGHTNIALFGVAGKTEEGGYLTDSIMLMSINPKIPSISMLSLPRDLYVDSEIGSHKINEIYAKARYRHREDKDNGLGEALQVAKKAISEFTGVQIHYGVVIDFKMFEKMIDTLGGVEIFVPETIEDPFYPDDNYGYQTFVVRKGFQTFDGETALKYARSRKTSSDYSRAQRQQRLLMAIKNKAISSKVLIDPDKLNNFYNLFKENVNTDLGIKDILSIGKISTRLDLDNVVSAVLNDDPSQIGGYLYSPAMADYGGQFVLLPKDLKETQAFMDLVLIHPDVMLENGQIAVLNGTKESGKAGTSAARLRRLGLHVIEVGNYDFDTPVVKTYLIDVSGKKIKTINFLKRIFETEKVDFFQTQTTISTKENTAGTPTKLENSTGDNGDLIDIKVILGTN